ncbi:hypothetical protein CUMW_284540 [Citrus unshiu]|uniref:Uncharacterized protein n=1 Tax=Citrus unshiu TaxID=55188 RepID=A0A2H5N2C7_CITUN|nr:hypothetical protein CUMW_284540 [Citrus unshiu]
MGKLKVSMESRNAKRLNPGGIEWNMHDDVQDPQCTGKFGRGQLHFGWHLLQINDARSNTPAPAGSFNRQIRYMNLTQ